MTFEEINALLAGWTLAAASQSLPLFDAGGFSQTRAQDTVTITYQGDLPLEGVYVLLLDARKQRIACGKVEMGTARLRVPADREICKVQISPFQTAEQFAARLAHYWGKARMQRLDALELLSMRVQALALACKQLATLSIEEGGIEATYAAVARRLAQTVSTGRLGEATHLRLAALSMRQLCKLVYRLDAQIGVQEDYSTYLRTHPLH